MWSLKRILRRIPALSQNFSQAAIQSQNATSKILPTPAAPSAETAESRKAKEYAMYTVCDGAGPKDAEVARDHEEVRKPEKELPSMSLKNF